MNRRDFIKNSLLLCGSSCLAYGCKVFYDRNFNDEIKIETKHLIEMYKNKNELPKKIRIDACTMCQLNCPACFMRLNPQRVKNGCGLGYLSFKDFKKFVDENNFDEIELSNNGEIFLNPELLDIIKYSYAKNIKLTDKNGVNLNYLPDNIAEALVKYQFRTLRVSIDGATPETYSIYRRGGDFNTVINNINKINFYKKKYNSIYPIMTYAFILFGHNEHEIDKAREIAKDLGMNIWFVQNWNPKYSPVKDVEMVIAKTGLDPRKSIDKYVAECYQKDNTQMMYCKELWENPQINWDGKVLGCCCVFDNDFGGNAFKDGLLKALNHPKMIYAKNMLWNNAKPIKAIPCTDCYTFSLIKQMRLSIKPIKRGDNLII